MLFNNKKAISGLNVLRYSYIMHSLNRHADYKA
jgi:hypothetical protein